MRLITGTEYIFNIHVYRSLHVKLDTFINYDFFNFIENLQAHSMNENMKHVFREKILRLFFMKLCTIVNCKKL